MWPGPFGATMMTFTSFGGTIGLEMDREAVAEEQRLALGEVRLDVLLVGGRLLGVGQRDEDHVARGCTASAVSKTSKPFSSATVTRFAAGIEADDDLDAAVLEVERVGVALGAEAEDGAGFAFEDAEVGVFVGVDFAGMGKG